MRIVAVVPAKHWRNLKTGMTASIYGSCPWTRSADSVDWKIEVTGWTWELSNGTIGLGRVPAETREEAETVMRDFNARFPSRSAT